MNNVIQQAQRLILRGYGYSQLLAELNLTEEEFSLICLKDLVFKNEVEKRYAIKIDTIVERNSADGVSERTQENRGKNKGNSKRSNKRNKGDDTPSIG